jgi:hypothetical protein
MNWEAIGAIGEIVGAITVVATLFYLAVQIRQSTKVSRADMTKDLFLASRSALLELSGNEQLAGIWAQIRGFEDRDFARRYTFYQSFFRLYELQFNLSAQGLLDDKIAESYMFVIRMFAATEHFDDYWRIAQSEFHDDFAKYVNEQRAITADAA